MTHDDHPPFASDLVADTRPARLYLPNGATRDSQLVTAPDEPPFAPELAVDQPSGEDPAR